VYLGFTIIRKPTLRGDRLESRRGLPKAGAVHCVQIKEGSLDDLRRDRRDEKGARGTGRTRRAGRLEGEL
jgi:hypothetical protein